jgi:hypothetical protein
MRENLREHLTQEITRKQFLQYTATAVLMVFGLDNLIALLTGTKLSHHRPSSGDSATDHAGFGSRKFGV